MFDLVVGRGAPIDPRIKLADVTRGTSASSFIIGPNTSMVIDPAR